MFDVSSPSSSVVLQHLCLQVNLSTPPWFNMYTTRRVDGKPYCLKKGELSEGPMSTNMLDALSSDFLYKICTYMCILYMYKYIIMCIYTCMYTWNLCHLC